MADEPLEDEAAVDVAHEREVLAERLRESGRWIALVVFGLVGLGTLMVFSTVAAMAAREGDLRAALAPLCAQAGKVGIGVAFYVLARRIPLETLLRRRREIFAAALALVALVCLPQVGSTFNGARRWLDVGPMYVQPAEFLKIAVVLLIAGAAALREDPFHDLWKGIGPIALALAASAGFLLLQPDFGSAVFVLGLGTLLLILGGARALHFAAAGGLTFVAVLGYALTSLGHVQERLAGYLNPRVGDQAYQSMLALGSGGAFGAGLGAGVAKLGYLPMISSDFILAAVGEELGFAGTTLVVSSFVVLLLLGTRVALAQPDRAGFLVAAGVTLMVCVQALVNVAVVTAAVPTKGIALPFLSAGGSSIAASLFGVGLLVQLAHRGGQPLRLEGVVAARPTALSLYASAAVLRAAARIRARGRATVAFADSTAIPRVDRHG